MKNQEVKTFTFTDVQSFLRPCVYIFRHSEAVQYVGKSKHGVLRPFDPFHETTSLPEFKYDKLEILWQESYEQAGKVEALLILTHRPLFNRRLGDKFKKKEWQGGTYTPLPKMQRIFCTEGRGEELRKLKEKFRHLHKRLHVQMRSPDMRCWFCNPLSDAPIQDVLTSRHYVRSGRYIEDESAS